MSRQSTVLVVASCASVLVVSVSVFIYMRNKKTRAEADRELKNLLNKERRPQTEEEDLEEAEDEEGEDEDEDDEDDDDDGDLEEPEGIGLDSKEQSSKVGGCCKTSRDSEKRSNGSGCCKAKGTASSCGSKEQNGLAGDTQGNFIDDDVAFLYPAADEETPGATGNTECGNGCASHTTSNERSAEVCGKLLFVSETGTSQKLAENLGNQLLGRGVAVKVVDARSYEPEDLAKESLVIIVASTWSEGKAPKNGSYLLQWLDESSEDFRVGSGLLQNCKVAIFGVGSSVYGENFNVVAKAFESHLTALGAHLILASGVGDDDLGDVEEQFETWSQSLVDHIRGTGAGSVLESSTENVPVSKENETLMEEMVEEIYYTDTDEEDKENTDTLVDLEDMAGALGSTVKTKDPKKKGFVRKGKKNVQGGQAKKVEKYFQTPNGDDRKEMVTPVLRASLEKQGYKILGSHSGVKLCRWTKSQLRGRGGCYKHSFYGIESHRCMETTPSLACANKCVFCWRHHTNPVGKSWRWKMDDPVEIVNAALDQHTSMIKQMKGVPGVKPERLLEGMTPRHCALSLVGEPIMYPEINTLVDELHKRRISSFLVTNAQFPDRITQLSPVTQLYVSVDAATKEKLKAIDRPLFSDFWERFTDSLTALRDKRQRTVYRLTLVKGWNVAELDAYVQLLQLGQPDFIEIKGVTYCGSTATSSLTMENVPWHQDVKDFAEAMVAATNGEYELSCEHVHSCCVLLAKVSKFKKDGNWYTWIDYEKFHDLVASGEPFSSEDYMMQTPSWAVYGAEEGGFDPKEVRVKKERRHGASADPGGCT
ncbi:tRNA wybutosine-synthesizing protein 1 [Marchantia polymorpha subsp. ruderalis]|uniref:tRNA 4-demethylwyosine synthase (AdoMet-dependent) n=1 Tax=Marchantia polymorpha subsp. ruderalis TaxID=1480154 RepID=A0A176WGU0_MARPO|nr:hypothetical protein AXG93_3218s1230 [Marchantia polymorpha subsp. ruderalis]BBN12758.1 hypothetical protein Mp_5g22650 [Marchantia polymorpha subsp. ruderalis]